uniref:hypothetical protein n=1 Tax=Vibrio cholerae TaxID=666 RepID=UPI001BD16A49
MALNVGVTLYKINLYAMEACGLASHLFSLGICAGVEEMSLSFNDKILTGKPVQVIGLRALLTL